MREVPYEGSVQAFDVVVERNVLIPMRDGVRLAADIYRPALNGRPVAGQFPVLVERTPYDKSNLELVSTGKFFARHGYVVVIQDVRGRGLSEGEWYPFAREAPDGYDTLAWVVRQEWCNGRVGTIGLSYTASDQHALAILNPPGLAAMFVSEGMSNYHKCAMRQGGAMELRFVVYAFRMATTSPEALKNRALREMLLEAYKNIHYWLKPTLFRPGTTPLRHLPTYEQWVFDVLTHGEYDDYWKQYGYNVEEYYDRHADVPIYFLSGWYDTYARASTENFVEFSRRKRSPMRLIMGPWTHGVATLRQSWSGDVDFGPDAILDDYDGFRLRWFDYWLKGLDTGVADEPPVRIFVMGTGDGHKTPEGRLFHGGYWRFEQEWPLARTQWTPYYLHAGGRLSPEPPGDEPPDSYLFNPMDPVPTIGGSISAAGDVIPPGGFDQRGRRELFYCRDTAPLAARPDVLVFQTDPLPHDVEVTGPIVVRLWASSSAVDTDFTAKLIDVYPPSEDYPDGYALNLTDSIIRARYRNGFERPEFMEPGRVYEFTITCYPTSNVFKKGHRIRLDISSSNWPRFDVNPNTGDPLGPIGRWQVAVNTVYHDRAHPSHVVLPIIPKE